MRFAGLFFGFDVFDFFVGEEAGGEEEGGHFFLLLWWLLCCCCWYGGMGWGEEKGVWWTEGGRLRVMGEEIRGVFMRNGKSQILLVIITVILRLRSQNSLGKTSSA